MRDLGALHMMAMVLLLLGLLPGCAIEAKCGFRGCPGDAAITAKVQAMINQHDDLGPPNQIYVQTQDHVVYLTGEVIEGNVSRTAEALALKSPGVARVVNNIAVEH
jgi:osmotically-inducible protein OsmY